ncbi:MAG TPA: T9SS type A sorting domain-containing protein [Elusimicrobiota bacterium]|nr:T9SS type A sorting domain-containing protein [Elusimicrobiota bacterium]
MKKPTRFLVALLLMTFLQTHGGAMGKLCAADDMNRAHPYPNPWKPTLSRNIRFTSLPETATIQIYTVAGALVLEHKHDDPSNGYWDWDVLNTQGDPVASDVYFYVIKNSSGKKTGKLIIQR